MQYSMQPQTQSGVIIAGTHDAIVQNQLSLPNQQTLKTLRPKKHRRMSIATELKLPNNDSSATMGMYGLLSSVVGLIWLFTNVCAF